MVVAPDGSFHGTIGGGTLEWRALAAAQGDIAVDMAPALRDYPLGPALGQCCGGHVTLAYQRFESAGQCKTWADAEEAGGLYLRFDGVGGVSLSTEALATEVIPGGGITQAFEHDTSPVLLFGAGHVGRAIVMAMAPLPFRVSWIDQRPDAFPTHVPASAHPISVQNPVEVFSQGLVSMREAGFVLVMTHSHALDLAICDATLRQDAISYVGLIGSATKRSRFRNRLRTAGIGEDGLEKLHSPIGLPGLRDKHPAAIAASVAADLLLRRQDLMANRGETEGLRRHG